MPQVQVLPGVPNFGTQLGQTLIQAGADLSKGYLQGQQNKVMQMKDMAALQQLQNPEASPLQKITAYMKLSENLKKGSAPAFAAYIGPQAQAQADLEAYQKHVAMQGPQAQNATSFSGQFPQGTMPQQTGDPNNIKPSVTPQPAAQQPSPGQPMPMQQPQPNQQDASEDRMAYLRAKAKDINNPNRFIAADAQQAKLELDHLEQLRQEKFKINERKSKEEHKASELRAAEDRKEIKDFSEPYKDKNKLETLVNKLTKAEELIKTGKVSVDENWLRTAVSAILEGEESPLAELVKTPEQQTLWYLLRDSLRTKDIGGANPSTKEVLLDLTSLPSIYKGKKANEFIIRNLIDNSKTQLYKADKIADLRAKNSGISAAEFIKSINDESSNYYNDLYEKSRKQFAPKISEAIALEYIQKAKGDRQLAEKMAREDGYEF